MKNFMLEPGGKIVFGGGCVREYLSSFALDYGPNVLLVSGVRSAREDGAYGQAVSGLQAARKQIIDFSGVRPGPDYETVQEGARLCRERQVDLILGVGGGSVIDCCKAVSLAAVCRDDLWQALWERPGVVDFQPLPVGIVPTTLGTGALNGAAVLDRGGIREARNYPQCAPKFVLFDPAYPKTLPREQVISDGFCIFSRALELYLAPPAEGAAVTDGVLEALMEQTVRVLRSGELLGDVCRADLMWSGALVGNDLLQAGKRCGCPCRREALALSRRTGQGFTPALAAVQLSACRFACQAQPARMARLAERVWGLSGLPKGELAQAGVEALAGFLRELGLSGEKPAMS